MDTDYLRQRLGQGIEYGWLSLEPHSTMHLCMWYGRILRRYQTRTCLSEAKRHTGLGRAFYTYLCRTYS